MTTFETLFPAGCKGKILSGDYPHLFYPAFTDRAAWEKTCLTPERKKFRENIIVQADLILKEQIPALQIADYLEFRVNGNRTHFESGYFSRRSYLGILVTALGLTGDGEKYFLPVLNYLWAIIEERTWCIHAHAARISYEANIDRSDDEYGLKDKYPLDPVASRQTDLFASVTAAVFAHTFAVCGDAIREYSPRVCEILESEVLKRTVYSVMDPEMDPYHGWLNGRNNWSPWICSNMLVAGACFLKKPVKFFLLVEKLNHTIGLWLDRTADNGYCEEGTGYWAKAGGKFLDYVFFMEKLFPGSMQNVLSREKCRAVMEFPAKTAYNEMFSLNFGDGGSRLFYDPSVLYKAGSFCHSDLLKRYAEAKLHQFFRNASNIVVMYDPQKKFRAHFNVGETLQIHTGVLFDMPGDLPSAAAFIPEETVLYQDQVGMISAGLFRASLKAGTNQEEHNHNDLGHFTLFYDGMPVIVDLGTNVYTQKTFTLERYESMFHNALGHNAPLFAGKSEQVGGIYTAGLSLAENTPERKTLVCDLSHAYPEEAGVSRFTRTVSVSAGECILQDKAEAPMPAELNFYTALPVTENGNILQFGEKILLDVSGFDTAEVIPFPCEDANICSSWGKNTLSRIHLVTGKKDYVLVFRRK